MNSFDDIAYADDKVLEQIVSDSAEIEKLKSAAEDAKKKELVETRNLAESMVTSTEKMLEENKDKATDDEIKAINESKDSLSKVLENQEATLEEMKNSIEELTKASQSFAEKLYAEAQQNNENAENDESNDDVVDGEVVEEDE